MKKSKHITIETISDLNEIIQKSKRKDAQKISDYSIYDLKEFFDKYSEKEYVSHFSYTQNPIDIWGKIAQVSRMEKVDEKIVSEIYQSFNKEQYVLYAGWVIQKEIEKMKNSGQIDKEKLEALEADEKKCKELLKNSHVQIAIISHRADREIPFDIQEFFSVDDLKGEKKKTKDVTKTVEILDKIDQEIGLKNFVLAMDRPTLCYEVFPNFEEATKFQQLLQLNFECEFPEGIVELSDSERDILDDKVINNFISFIKRYPEKISLKKLLLKSAYYNKRPIGKEMLNDEEMKNCSKIIKLADEYLRELQEDKKVVQIYNNDIKVIDEYNGKMLKKDAKQMIEEIYISDKELQEYKNICLRDKDAFQSCERRDVFELAKFSKEEINELIQVNQENLKLLIKFDAIKREDFIQILSSNHDKLTFSEELSQLIVDRKLMEKEDILPFYLDGILNLKQIQTLQEKIPLEEEIGISQLLEEYQKMRNGEKAESKFEKIGLLYREVILKNWYGVWNQDIHKFVKSFLA